MAYTTGLPKLYVILNMDFKVFKERVMKRGRKSEVEEFSKNLEYFKLLHNGYDEKMIELCKIFNIPYLIIDANMKTVDQIKLINKKIKSI
jgi:deoxyadenosine/deoxycytidine kinase